MTTTSHDPHNTGVKFPALGLCTVIDSRLSSRREILEHLNSTTLFSKVHEARSIDHGLNILDSEVNDVCIIGPSVSAAAASAFFKRSRKIAAAADTAFIAIINDTSTDESFLAQNGMHGVLRKPYDKDSLADKVVRSVVKANKNSPWRPLLASIERNTPTKIREQLSAEEIENSDIFPEQASAVVEDAVSGLKQLTVGHENGSYSLGIDGIPSTATLSAIRQIVAEALRQAELNINSDHPFALFLESSIIRWFCEMVLSSEKKATADFRRQIDTYVSRIAPLSHDGR